MEKDILYKLIDYVLLNSTAVSSAGLMNGKAGMSLCLFEAARYLKDEKVEDNAFELIQEAIVLTKETKDCSFVSGLSGIGFVLLYLLKNGFLEGEFGELFGRQFRKILESLEHKDIFTDQELFSIYFLFPAGREEKDFTGVPSVIDKILDHTEEKLKMVFDCFDNIYSGINKLNVQALFIRYLKIICYTGNYSRACAVIEWYRELFNQGRLRCDFQTGFYLQQIAGYLNQAEIRQLVMNNKITSVCNLHPDTLTLRERTGWLYSLSEENQENVYDEIIHSLEKGLFDVPLREMEKNIIHQIPPATYMAGYEAGVSRFLLYCFYREYKKRGEDCSRFACLF